MTVFAFQISDLVSKKVYKQGSNDLRREEEFLKRQFQSWGITEGGRVSLDEDTLHKIIQADGVSEEESAQLLVEWAEKLGAIFKSAKLSSSQLRGFFGTTRAIQQQSFGSSQSRRKFILLLPKLRYAEKRANVLGMEGLQAVLSEGIRYVKNDPENFKRFMEFFEAILAYHKAYGGS